MPEAFSNVITIIIIIMAIGVVKFSKRMIQNWTDVWSNQHILKIFLYFLKSNCNAKLSVLLPSKQTKAILLEIGHHF